MLNARIRSKRFDELSLAVVLYLKTRRNPDEAFEIALLRAFRARVRPVFREASACRLQAPGCRSSPPDG
jgi:hypothetical protein